MSGHKTLSVPPKWGNQRPNIEQLTSSRGKINYRNSLSLSSPIVEVINSVTSKNTVVLTLAGHSEKLFAQFQSEKYFANGYANIFGHLSNSLINIQTLDLASGHTLGYPITLGQLPNPLKYSHTAYLQSGHNMRVSFSDAQTLRSSLSGAQKEKDSTANATLWRKSDLSYEELQELKNLISLRVLVGYCSIHLPSLRGVVPQVNNVHLVSYYSDDALVLRWRRLISVLAAATKNPAVLSSCSLTCSINSKSSSGSLTETCRDLLLRLPVAITESPFVRWCSVCTKIYLFQVLTWCSPRDILVVFTLIELRQKQQRPEVLATTIEASNQKRKGVLRYGYPTA